MRDINRIDPLLAKLGELWKQYPDMRFGQLIINLLDNLGRVPWYLEDYAWLEYLDSYLKINRPESRKTTWEE